MTDWRVEHITGPAEELFNGERSSAALLARGGHLQPSLRFVTVDAPTLVLGSGQHVSILGAVPGHVRRRSGGGAVWLDPVEHVWVDVIVPTGHPLWTSDVTLSFDWLGVAWLRAVRALGVTEPLDVHRGRLVSSPWSALLCFAGRGPGEVFVRNRKLVGIAQRRSRGGVLFQCGILRRWTFRADWFASDAWPGPLEADVAEAGIGLENLLVGGGVAGGMVAPSDTQIQETFVEAVSSFDNAGAQVGS